jgi:dihydrofolate reductase
MISIIVAVAENLAIGKNNSLLWHIPEDLKRFKRITGGHTVIMGKRTWESLPVRPLPNRKNIVITDDPEDNFPGCIAVFSIREALDQCPPDEECFVIGGASVYAQFLPLADRLYITQVHKEFEGDAFFPSIDGSEWDLSSEEKGPGTADQGFDYSYLVYDRIKKSG